MENNRVLVKIKVTHKDSNNPAVGYTIDVIELSGEEGEKITDSNGEVEPFYMDLNNFIYADIFVRDQDDNMIVQAEGQYALTKPETIIHIEV